MNGCMAPPEVMIPQTAPLPPINQIVTFDDIIDSDALMRYVQLRAFHYVATCGGFSRAAEELFLTQPAISDQVRK
ncbi:MAG: LysR family transcriptional regulator, partial [Gemmobacter sp.]